jgi:acyl carrier protein
MEGRAAMSSESGIEPQDLADRLRGDPLISDVEVMSGPEQGRVTAFIVGKGFRPGPELREKAMSLAGELSGRLQVAILPKIPRRPDGSLDKEQAVIIIRRPRMLLRFEPPATDSEREVVELLSTLLPVKNISMSDYLGNLGADSITIIELASLIADEFGIEISPLDMFRLQSIRELVALVFPGA